MKATAHAEQGREAGSGTVISGNPGLVWESQERKLVNHTSRELGPRGPCQELGMTLGDSWVDLGSQETTRDAWWRMARREGTGVLELEHPAVIGERWRRLGKGSDRSLIRGHPRGRAERTGKTSLQMLNANQQKL